MKFVFSLMLCLFITFSSTALAAKYNSTEMFLDELEEDGRFLNDYDFDYSYEGIDGDNDDRVDVSFSMDDMKDLTVNVYFHDTETSCSMYLWDVIEFSESDRSSVIEVVNDLNYSYRYGRWYVMDDNTVNIQLDSIFRDGYGTGEALVESLSLLIRVTERGYSELEEYDL